MALEKLTALTTYLQNSNLFADEQFDSWMTNGVLTPQEKLLGAGLSLGENQYTAVFVIEAFAGDANLLLALISVWLNEFDCNRVSKKLSAPSIDVDILDDNSADIEIQLDFVESITAIPDPDGLIVIDGNHYSLGEVPIYSVNNSSLSDNPQLPNDPTVSHAVPVVNP